MRFGLKRRLAPLLFVGVVLGSCRIQSGSLVTPSPSSPPLSTSAYATEELCGPAKPYCGAVRGRLQLKNGQPAVGSILYLSEYVGPEDTPLVVLSPAEHLHVETGEGGAFCFREVASGKYALIVWNAVDSILLDDPDTGYSFAIDVEPGGITDVGTVYTPVP